MIIYVKLKSGYHYYINDIIEIREDLHFILLKSFNSLYFNRSISKEKLLSFVCRVPGFRL